MFDLRVIDRDLFLTKRLIFKKKFSNNELNLYRYFFFKTKIYPDNVILIKGFVFFFVRNEDYFKAKFSLNIIRKELKKKILIIRAENNLIKLLFSFFPDLYIHDVELECDYNSNNKIVHVYFLSFEDRGIAVGHEGDYIKTINEIFKKYIIFENSNVPIKIKCELAHL